MSNQVATFMIKMLLSIQNFDFLQRRHFTIKGHILKLPYLIAWWCIVNCTFVRVQSCARSWSLDYIWVSNLYSAVISIKTKCKNSPYCAISIGNVFETIKRKRNQEWKPRSCLQTNHRGPRNRKKWLRRVSLIYLIK